MKKSIFLFFAAILCAMSVSAKVIYFKPNGNWAQANASFYANVWGGSGVTNPVKFTPVATDPDVYEAEVGTHTSIILLRHDPAKTVTSSNMWSCWNRMGDLSIPTDGKNCCTINEGEWTQEKTDASSHVTWSTYTPPTEVVIPDRYITGTIAGGWNANDVKMTYDEATETYSHTFTAVAAGELHQFKVTDGTWSKNWGGDAVSPAIEGVTNGSDGNVAFTLSVGGDVTITFKDSKIQLTTTGSFTPVETFDYYVVGSFNGWNTADAAYGMTKDGDVYKKEVTFAAAVEFKVCDGTWGAAWGANNLGDNKYTELEGTDNLKMKEEKTFTIIFDPAQNLLTFEGLTAEAVVTYDYYIAGTLAGGWSAKQQGMEKDGDVYKATFSELAAGTYEFKITDGQWNSEGDNTHEHTTLGAAYEEVSYNEGNIKIVTDEAINLTVIFDAATDKITFDGLTPVTTALTYKVKVPAGTDECYIAGPCNSWDFRQMTREGTTDVFTIDIVGAKETDAYKYACQADWAYAEVIDGGGNRTNWSELDEVTAWNKPVVYTYYLMGVDDDWATGIEMEVNTDAENEVMLTCQPVNGQVKIKRVGDDDSEYWFGGKSLKEDPANLGTNTEAATDGDGNIALEEGIYNFYFNTADGKLWIAAATDCETTEEIGDILDLTMTNLVVTPMGTFDLLEASENEYGISVTLGVDTDGNLIDGSNVTMNDETELPINYDLSGKFTKSTDAEIGDVYSGLVVVEFDGGLMGLQLTMYASTIEVTQVNLTGGTVTLNEFGAYVMSAKWDNEDVTVELTSLEMEDWVSIAIGEDRVLSGMATVTNQDGVVTLVAEGLNEYDESWTSIVAIYDITITATLDLKDVVVYFINTPKWTAPIYAYATMKTGWGRYQEVIAENAPSPGVVATKEDYQIAGYDVYSYTALEGTYNSVQFSGNEMATDEAGWESDMYYIHNFDGNSGWYTKADAETLLTPQVELTEITLTSGDNSALLAAADGKTVDVTVERSFTAGGLHTIALPFKLTNVAGVFGVGTVVYEFAELRLENNDLALYFDATKTTIEAGKPYLIVPAQSVNGFEVDDATISAAPQPISFTVGNATVTMEPVLTVATNAKTNGKYWLASDTYLYNTSTALKSLCAVFDIQSQKSNVRARIAFNENAATGFDNIVAPEGQTIKAIVNGQLVIIRGGEMYNVQGQKL